MGTRWLALTLIAALLVASCVWFVSEQGRARETCVPALVPILMYHQLSAEETELCVDPTSFRAQMEFLNASGHSTITLGELRTHLAAGTPTPRGAVVVTFDDSYESLYRIAYPTLKEQHMTATFFVPTGFVGLENRVTWPQLREMATAGFEIGSHSVTHPYLADVSSEALRAETVCPKDELERKLGVKVISFSYPYGQHNAKVEAAVSKAGYEVAVTTTRGYVTQGDKLFALQRLPVYRSLNLEGFAALLEGVAPYPTFPPAQPSVHAARSGLSRVTPPDL